MAYAISFAPSAAKDFRALDVTAQRRVGRAIDQLAGTPRPDGVQKLRGADDLYRIRVGDYRVIYQISDRKVVVLVVRVRHRRDAYR